MDGRCAHKEKTADTHTDTYRLLNFLFKPVKFGGIEKLFEGDIYAVADDLDCGNLRVFAFPV